MTIIAFTVPGQPVAKARPRVRRDGRTYTPAHVVAYEKKVALYAGRAFEGEPIEGPVVIDALFVIRRPKNQCRRKDPEGRQPHIKRPDLDNLLKALVDGISRAGVWGDDSQASYFRAAKVYGGKGEEPCAEVTIVAHKEGTR